MLKKFLIATILCFAWTQGIVAKADDPLDPKKAEAFMSDIGNHVINLLTDKTISTQERTKQFRTILDTKFNVKSIAKFVLGRYWKQATKEEQEKFIALFESTTAATYATRFQDYTSEKLEILGSRLEKDGGVTVLSRIVREDGDPITMNWKLFKKKGEIRIYDIHLEGISMGITQRSEFASVIQKGGGHINALLNALATKKQSE